METNKRILIVSPFFAPENSVASIRFTKLGKYLSKMGYRVTVFCADMNEHYSPDELLVQDQVYFDKIVRVRQSKLYYLPMRNPSDGKVKPAKTNVKKKDCIGKWIHKAIAFARTDKTSRLWALLVDQFLVRKYVGILKHMSPGFFDTVITTYSPIASHFVGYYMKRRNLCGQWIADYRDTMSSFTSLDNVPYLLKKYNMRFQKKADAVTVVSEGQREQLIGESWMSKEELRSKTHVVYNGYDTEDAKSVICRPSGTDRLVICYCGSFYCAEGKYHNYPYILFRLLKELHEEGRIHKHNVEMVYAGKSFDILKDMARACGMEEILTDLGYIARKNVLEVQAGADIILTCVWNDRERQGVLSGKFFDAMLLGKPTLAIVNGDTPESEIKRMVNRYHLGVCWEEAEQADTEILKKWLEKTYRKKMREGEVKPAFRENYTDFSYSCLAETFSNIIERVNSNKI